MGQLEGNITALDVSEQTGTTVTEDQSIVVDEDTGETSAFTMVVMGSDSRKGKGNKGYGSLKKFGDIERSDTTMIFHVNADRSQAIGVSIPRDTLMTLPDCTKEGKTVDGYEGRFNEAMVNGGPGCVLKAVESLSGLAIDNFMVVDFAAFKRITEAIGGVEICLQDD
ncbi:MAG: LytR family transcriptional regulator, partial [Actinobacteria bacterium]|nr:LytR family transcriptional regulator [Actinomycetota bacterium]